MNTHPEQWAANAAAPGEQLGVRCLAQGSHLSRGIEGGERALYIHSNPQPRVTSPTLYPLGHDCPLWYILRVKHESLLSEPKSHNFILPCCIFNVLLIWMFSVPISYSWALIGEMTVSQSENTVLKLYIIVAFGLMSILIGTWKGRCDRPSPASPLKMETVEPQVYCTCKLLSTLEPLNELIPD